MNEEVVKRDLVPFRLFQDVEPMALDQIAHLAERRRYTAGDMVFDDGDTPTELYLIESGHVAVRLFSVSPGKEFTVSELGAGQILGEFCLLDRSLRSAGAECTEITNVIVLRLDDLEKLLSRVPSLGYRVMQNAGAIVADRIKLMNRAFLTLFEEVER